jgi:hypothetical protein
VSFHANVIVREWSGRATLAAGKGKLDNGVERTEDERFERFHVSSRDHNVINSEKLVSNSDEMIAVEAELILEVINVNHGVRWLLLY